MSEGAPRVELLFLWHHHQPDYRSPRTGTALLPWVRLHAVKDYLDMALRLERHPRLRATFNFVPSLIDQIEDATAGRPDALFDLLRRPVADLAPDERVEITFRCGTPPPRMLERWPEYAALCRRARRAKAGRGAALEGRELEALEASFLLAWLDPMFLAEPEAAAAAAATRSLDAGHRDALLALYGRLVAGVMPAYRRLADRGQIELSTSPYAHPILPLLVDTSCARRARPDLHLPSPGFAAPEDAARQIERAIARHAEVFGASPRGLWPSEGSVSPEVAELVASRGLAWMATDEGNLWRSLPLESRKRGCVYRPWSVRTAAGPLAVFFRDRELSDRIGFVYHHWEPAEAVADFLARLRKIGETPAGAAPPLVTVALDGENCWEHYAADGGPFLDALYDALDAAEDIRTVTPSEVLERRGPGEPLATLHSGSWIDSDFHIWIGHPEKNRAWERIATARADLVASGAGEVEAPAAWHSLHAAEGSDWFWWLGIDHHTLDKDLFDRILREHLAGTYQARGAAPPAWVEDPIVLVSRTDDEYAPLGWLRPVLDGRVTSYFEWRAAGRVRPGAGGAMHHAAGLIRDLFYGFDETHLFLRVDLDRSAGLEEPQTVEIESGRANPPAVLRAPAGPGEHVMTGASGKPVDGSRVVCHEVLELAVPLAALDAAGGPEVQLVVRVRGASELLGAVDFGGEPIRIPGPEDEAAQWSA